MSDQAEDLNIARWDKYYEGLKESYLFPNEFVVRSFLGKYPGLAMPHLYQGAKACDISCGDGRNTVVLHKLGMHVYATELSDAVCNITKEKLAQSVHKIAADIRPGSNVSLPFEDNFFDYLLSWNAFYYMQNERSNISDHVAEYARIAKPGSYLVMSVPSPDCFSLEGSEDLGNHLIRLRTKDKWSMLDGSVYYRFSSFEHIESVFGSHFTNFQKCTISDDCFGLKLGYFVFVCQKRTDI
jgi:ubiquinone/menaquinone biosynthesis C-methylase UbiE